MLLQRIFRARRSSRRQRLFTPALLDLESRQLLDGSIPLGANLQAVQLPTGSSVVGQRFNLQVVHADGTPYAPGELYQVNWTVDGAVKSRTLDVSGFHDTSIDPTTSGLTVDQNQGYWTTPGTHFVHVDKILTPPMWQGIPLGLPQVESDNYMVTVNAPEVTSSTHFGSTSLTTDWNGTKLTTFDQASLTPGLSTYLNIDPGQNGVYNGTFGVVQILDPSLSYYKVINGWPQKFNGFTNPDGTSSGPLLDKISTSDFPYYNGKATVGGGGLMMDDSPSSGFGVSNYRMIVQDKFTDTVMYTPTGGIPVPVATAQWSWGGTVIRNAQGQPTVLSKTDPAWNLDASGNQGWQTPSSFSVPRWNGRVSDYITDGYLNLIQVPLSSTDQPPDLGLVYADPWDYDPYNYAPWYVYVPGFNPYYAVPVWGNMA